MVQNCAKSEQLSHPCSRVTIVKRQHDTLAMFLHGQFENLTNCSSRRMGLNIGPPKAPKAPQALGCPKCT